MNVRSKDEGLFTTGAMTIIGVLAGLAILQFLPMLLSVRLPGQTAWYGARAAGMMAYLLATASVLFGMGITTRMGGRFLGKANIADTHRSLSLLSLVAIGAHTLFLALDSYAKFGPVDLFVPLATWYKPAWTGLGIIAAYLAVAVYASFYLRSLIGYKAWRTFHYAAFAVFVLGTFHGLFAGSDAGTAWALAIYGSSTAAVLSMFAYRMSTRRVAGPAREAVAA
jgi:sulfoxide reductase heme-binding subunit YedZ